MNILNGTTSLSYLDALNAVAGTTAQDEQTAWNAYLATATQSQIVTTGGYEVGKSNIKKQGQQFTAVRTNFDGVTIQRAANTGTFAGDITVSLQSETAGLPSGTVIASVAIANAVWNAITTNTDYTVVFNQAITPGTNYWIVIDSSTYDASNYTRVNGNSNAGLPNHRSQYNTSWAAAQTTSLYYKILSSGLLSILDAANAKAGLTGQNLNTCIARIVRDVSTFYWKGYTWTKRDGGTGAPGMAGWSKSNIDISNILNDGSIKFAITNAGTSPVGCELQSVKTGWGYGTYTIVVSADLYNMHKSVVFGGLFPYDNAVAVYFNEIDIHETSAWGNNVVPTINHAHWYNSGGVDTSISVINDVPTDLVQTHVLIWAADSLTFRSYIGQGTNGPLIFETIQTTHLPTPAAEQLLLNLWVYNAGDPTHATPITVTVKDFVFPYAYVNQVGGILGGNQNRLSFGARAWAAKAAYDYEEERKRKNKK
jgi:hypothetical protein